MKQHKEAVPTRKSGIWAKSFYWALAVWILTRSTLALIGVYSYLIDGQKASFIKMWMQWDANFYLSIAHSGYMVPNAVTGLESGQSNINFFPLMPIGTALLDYFVGSTALAGLMFSNICLLIAAVMLHRLASERINSAAADWAVISLLTLPGSFALSGALSESTFLALSTAAIYFVHRDRISIAVGCASLLTVTRLTGIALGIGFLADWFTNRWRRQKESSYTALMMLSFIPLPLVLFCFYMLYLTDDALAPIHSNFAFWSQSLGVPFQSLFMFSWTNQPRLVVQSFLSLLLIGIIIVNWRIFSLGELLFVILSVFSFASSFSASPSLIRYTLALYPLHLAFGRLCGRYRLAQLLLISLAIVNGALALLWFHGSEAFV